MKKRWKLLLVLILSIVGSISFTKVIADYHNYKFVNGITDNSEMIHFIIYEESIDSEKVKEDFLKVLSENDLTLISIGTTHGQVINYYNFDAEGNFLKMKEDYQTRCDYKCFELVEKEKGDLRLELIYFVYGENLEGAFDDLNTVDFLSFINDNHDEEYDNHETVSPVKMFLDYYLLYLVITGLSIFSLFFLIFLETISKIKEIQLQSMFGYSFKTFFVKFVLKLMMTIFIPYFIFLIIGSYLYSRSPSIVSTLVLIQLLIMIISFILILCFSKGFYTNISKKFMYGFSKIFISIMSIIIIIFTVVTISLSLFAIESSIKLRNQLLVSDNLEKYYKVDYSVEYSNEIGIEMSNELIDKGEASYYSYEFIDSITPNAYLFHVDKYFFDKHSDIFLNSDEKINLDALYDESYGCVYFAIPEIYQDEKFENEEECKLYEIKNNNKEYLTYDVDTPNFTLYDTIIKYTGDYYGFSNIIINASSEEKAKQIVLDVYNKYDVRDTPNVREAFLPSFREGAIEEAKSSISALLFSLISLIIATSFYIQLIFMKYKDEIMLSTIYGYSKKIVMKRPIQELLITNISVFIIILLITKSLLGVITYFVLIIVQFIIMFIRTNNLIKSNLVEYLKGELQE